MFRISIFIVIVLLVVSCGIWQNNHIPTNLGVNDGALKGCLNRPNCVSSKDQRDSFQITPLPNACPNIIGIIVNYFKTHYQTEVITQTNDYLHLEVSTTTMKFKDDLEFHVKGKYVDVRSSSRVGYSDLGVNRKRIEGLREYLEKFKCADNGLAGQ